MLLNLIDFLNGLPAEFMLLVEFSVCLSILLLFTKFFRLLGLYAFIISALFIVNIQVLKIVEYAFYPDPIALGKVIICCIFLAMDIIVECYGKQKAQHAIWLGLSSNIMVSIMMLVTIGYKPFMSAEPHYSIFLIQSESIKTIFLPLPGILIASIISYIVSQYTDVHLFNRLKEKTKGKHLWLRSFVSPAISSLLDNILFYTIAFYILSPQPLKVDVLIHTYILGTYLFRLVLIFISSYVIYYARWLINPQQKAFSTHLNYESI